MHAESLAQALEREHHDIDAGIEAFAADPTDAGRPALTRAVRALRRHIYLEEQFLFPPLRNTALAVPVFVMLREHGQIWATLDELEHGLRDGASGLALCNQLAIQLQHHNLKEERVLYPQADAVLTAPVAEELRTFLDTGELPEGWVCHGYDPKRR